MTERCVCVWKNTKLLFFSGQSLSLSLYWWLQNTTTNNNNDDVGVRWNDKKKPKHDRIQNALDLYPSGPEQRSRELCLIGLLNSFFSMVLFLVCACANIYLSFPFHFNSLQIFTAIHCFVLCYLFVIVIVCVQWLIGTRKNSIAMLVYESHTHTQAARHEFMNRLENSKTLNTRRVHTHTNNFIFLIHKFNVTRSTYFCTFKFSIPLKHDFGFFLFCFTEHTFTCTCTSTDSQISSSFDEIDLT